MFAITLSAAQIFGAGFVCGVLSTWLFILLMGIISTKKGN